MTFDGDHDGNDARQVGLLSGRRASTRARSYRASPGGCKASVLCISLWMLSANRLVTCHAAVDERGCGKVDNSEDASLAQVGKLLLSTTGGTIHSAACEFCYPSDGHAR